MERVLRKRVVDGHEVLDDGLSASSPPPAEGAADGRRWRFVSGEEDGSVGLLRQGEVEPPGEGCEDVAELRASEPLLRLAQSLEAESGHETPHRERGSVPRDEVEGCGEPEAASILAWSVAVLSQCSVWEVPAVRFSVVGDRRHDGGASASG